MSDLTPPVPPTVEQLRPIEVHVVSPRPRRRWWLHVLLLVLTLGTTLVVGARLEFNFLNNLPAFSLDDTLPMFPLGWIAAYPPRLLLGVPFAATLMIILLAHEMGHYLFCLRYGVKATLPFFIPAPTLIGTLGAFIRIKSPIRSREALFDIGIAGPFAGFILALLTLVVALTLSKPMPPGMAPWDVVVGYPLVFHFAQWLLGGVGVSGVGHIPLHAVYLHPTAIAAWVGMFATALNLLPGGQLDGGHIVYALAPRAHGHISRITVGMLLPMGYFLWKGWFVWALLLTFSGIRHPQVPPWPGVSGRRWLLALIGLAILIVTFVPEPLSLSQAALR